MNSHLSKGDALQKFNLFYRLKKKKKKEKKKNNTIKEDSYELVGELFDLIERSERASGSRWRRRPSSFAPLIMAGRLGTHS